MIYPGGRFFATLILFTKFQRQRQGYDEERWTTGAAGSGGVGLNFVVIKLGLHNMPPLMLAGCALCWSPSRRCCLSPGQLFRCACCWAMA